MTFSVVLVDELRHVKDHCCPDMSEQSNMYFPAAEIPLLANRSKFGLPNGGLFQTILFTEVKGARQVAAKTFDRPRCSNFGFGAILV